MSEEIITSGVEAGTVGTGEPAAAGQEEYTAISYDSLDGVSTATPTTETSGVESGQEPASPAAGDGKDPQQQQQEQAGQFDQKTEEAFAKRLSAETGKIEQRVYQQAQNELLQHISPILELVEMEAQRHGYEDPVAWARAINSNRGRSYQDQLKQQAEELGIDPGVLNSLIEGHPDVLTARQVQKRVQEGQQTSTNQARINQEAAEFLQAYPDVDLRTIPDEVFAAAKERGIPLLDAYNRVMTPKRLEQTRIEAEQAAIKAQKQNAQGSPGALGTEQAAAPKKTAWDLSDAEFKALQQRVRNGEKIKFN